ncbi:helix-turn-helix domain-containing protein [Sphingobacterium anhuiense]|uniref:helix-turn-helix domain-containing protein n=1 Tax=Sphingobacterium anhuiense TaxID=493780 RepID=UPI003C2B9F66
MSQLNEIVIMLREINEKMFKIFWKIFPNEVVKQDVDVDLLMTRMMVVSRLGISERTYNRWVKAGVLKPIVLGNKHYYREEDLREAIKRSVNRGLI